MIELVVPIHPALEDLWRLFEPSRLPDDPSEDRFGSMLPFELVALLQRFCLPPPPLPPHVEARARRWHAYMGRLHRAREACLHVDPFRVLWADWTVTALCPDCGHHGRPVAVPKTGYTLVIPRDLKEFQAITGTRSIRIRYEEDLP